MKEQRDFGRGEHNQDLSEREKDWETERKKLLNPEIKGITNFYSSSEKRKPTNSSHCDLLSI